MAAMIKISLPQTAALKDVPLSVDSRVKKEKVQVRASAHLPVGMEFDRLWNLAMMVILMIWMAAVPSVRWKKTGFAQLQLVA